MENTNVAWTELGLSEPMLEQIKLAGYPFPSPVQAQTIPKALQGLDVLVSSQTGSGKTASFVIPTVERFKNKNGTYVLALSPTREIAQQTGAVFEAFAKPFGLKVVVCIGGASIPEEKEALAGSPHIIVATPGRLCDHLERGNVWLDFIQCLIFDEADRMLDMGFQKQIDTITDVLPKERQTLMLSATFAAPVEKLAVRAMKNPEKVTIEKTEKTIPKIDQRLFWVAEDRKLGELIRLLHREKGTAFIFVNQKEKTYQLARNLINKGITDVTYIHSDLQQEHRELAVAEFKSGKYRIIVATDVMGRGIDVDDVALVVNYDVPREAEDYIHRIGRTGRRGQTGHAATFAVPGKDDKYIKAIERLRGVEAPPKPEREERAERGERSDRGSRDGQRRDRRPRGDRPREDRPPREGQEARPPREPREPRPPREGGEQRPPRERRPRGERPQGERREPHRSPRPNRHHGTSVENSSKPAPKPAPAAPASAEGFMGKVKKKILGIFGKA